jgi:hypothetical protein
VVSKTDRGYEDYVSDRITEAFWTRKSAEWEAELRTIDAERAPIEDFRSREKAEFLDKSDSSQVATSAEGPAARRLIRQRCGQATSEARCATVMDSSQVRNERRRRKVRDA